MDKCKRCGSYAINHHQHGRDGSDGDLCDVCYWRKRADGGARWQRKRAETQMTLGRLIAALEAMPADAQVANLRDAHSYRGYYSDLAFERSDDTRSAAELLAECKDAMGQVFTGYKGGDYVMNALTPVWVAHYGRCGDKLMALHDGGEMETAKDE